MLVYLCICVFVYLFIIAFYRTCPHLTFQQALLPGATLGKLTATVPFHIPLSAKSQTKTLFYFYSLSTYHCLQRARHWLLPMHAEWNFCFFLKQREDFNVVTKATQFVQYHLQTLICLNIKGCTLLSQQQRVYPYQRREKRWWVQRKEISRKDKTPRLSIRIVGSV